MDDHPKQENGAADREDVVDTRDPKQTGAMGGRARAAKMAPQARREVSLAANRARWSHPRATHVGELPIGDLKIDCAVLENGRRIINDSAFQKALGRSQAGGQTYQRRAASDSDQLPIYVALKNLKRFIPQGFSVSTIQYIRPGGGLAVGVDAAVIPAVCSIWLAARRAGALRKQQLPTAEKAEIITNALATVGIIALIDEATGYQEDRARDALAMILEAFIGKELARWSRTFEVDYYKEMFRLRGWTNDYVATSKPPLIGKLTNNIVYARLAPQVLEELRKKNPRTATGHRRHKHHQWLSQGFGHPKLREHLAKVIALMQISSTWEEFMVRLDYVAPKHTGYLFSFDETIPRPLPMLPAAAG